MKSKGTVILLDGTICSGKTTYARSLQKERGAVLFVEDELLITLGIPMQNMEKLLEFVMEKTTEIVMAGVDVILESGYFTKAERDKRKQYFKDRGVPYEWHYLDISPETWRKNIAQRNAAHVEGQSTTYLVTDEVIAMFEKNFNPPSREEVDVWVDNNR